MAKKKVAKPRREVTRRQRSRLQQQKRRQRIVFGSAVLIVVAVLSIIGVGVYKGWYVSDYKPLHETVIEVNDTKFDMDYYIKVLEYSYYVQGISAEYMQFYMQSIADEVVRAIGQNELIRQGAMELGISVSDDEVDEELAERVDRGLNGYAPSLVTDYRVVVRDVVRRDLLVERLRDEYFDLQVPQSAEQRYIMAMFLESEAQANEVAARLDAGEDFTELAAELSLDDVTKVAEGDLGWRPLGVLPLIVESAILEESAFNIEVGVLSPPIYEETKTKMVGYWLIEVIEVDDSAEPAEAELRVMLLGSEQEANEIIARLEADEDFAELAAEYSRHTTSKEDGGELVVTQDMVTLVFGEFVFDPEVELGTLSPPIRDEEANTEGGYWLILIVDVDDNRQIDDENRDVLKSDALGQWVEGLRDDPDNNIVSYLDEEKKEWAILYVIGG